MWIALLPQNCGIHKFYWFVYNLLINIPISLCIFVLVFVYLRRLATFTEFFILIWKLNYLKLHVQFDNGFTMAASSWGRKWKFYAASIYPYFMIIIIIILVLIVICFIFHLRMHSIHLFAGLHFSVDFCYFR